MNRVDRILHYIKIIITSFLNKLKLFTFPDSVVVVVQRRC